MTSPSAIDSPDEISAAWMSEALSRPGNRVTVTSLRYEKIGTGQTGACYRFHLEHGADAPKTVIVKTAAGTPEQRTRVARGYTAEVLFYDVVAPRSNVTTPKCWTAATRGAEVFTLVLEDASPAVAGEQERGCSTDQAKSALANLARLHASTWNADILEDEAAWLRTTPERATRLAGIYADAVPRFLDLYSDHFSVDEARCFRGAIDVMHDFLLDGSKPQVLIHGDFRLDNLLFPLDPLAPVMAVDWQTLEIGQPGRDVAYFIATAFDPETRRKLEEEMLGTYHAELLANGVTGYDIDACRNDYRRGSLQTALITIIGCVFATGERSAKSDGMFLSMAHRAAAAIRDHGSIALNAEQRVDLV